MSRIRWEELKHGDTLLVSHLETYKELKSKYDVSVIDGDYKHTKLLIIR